MADVNVLLLVLGALPLAIFVFVWVNFWDVGARLRNEIRSDLLAAQGRIWGDEFAPKVAQLLIDVTRETGPILEDASVKQIADTLTGAAHFEKLRQAYDAGLAAEKMEQDYQQLRSHGGRAFWSLAFACLATPGSWLFALLPGFENKEGWWMALAAGWGVALAGVFLFGGFHVVRFWRCREHLQAALEALERLDRFGV